MVHTIWMKVDGHEEHPQRITNFYLEIPDPPDCFQVLVFACEKESVFISEPSFTSTFADRPVTVKSTMVLLFHQWPSTFTLTNSFNAFTDIKLRLIFKLNLFIFEIRDGRLYLPNCIIFSRPNTSITTACKTKIIKSGKKYISQK